MFTESERIQMHIMWFVFKRYSFKGIVHRKKRTLFTQLLVVPDLYDLTFLLHNKYNYILKNKSQRSPMLIWTQLTFVLRIKTVKGFSKDLQNIFDRSSKDPWKIRQMFERSSKDFLKIVKTSLKDPQKIFETSSKPLRNIWVPHKKVSHASLEWHRDE